MAHQVDDIVQLEQVANLLARVDEANEAGAHLWRDRLDSVADDAVQQLVGVPGLAAALRTPAKLTYRSTAPWEVPLKAFTLHIAISLSVCLVYCGLYQWSARSMYSKKHMTSLI
jgi:hypothetical protein